MTDRELLEQSWPVVPEGVGIIKIRSTGEPDISNEMKARHIGEYDFHIHCTDEDGEEINRVVTVPWDVCKTIYKEMAKSAMLSAPAPDIQYKDATETAADVLIRLGDDASKWANEFRSTAIHLGYSDMDEGWLIGWFANAIEHSFDVRRWRAEKQIPTTPAPDHIPDAGKMVPMITDAADLVDGQWYWVKKDNGKLAHHSPLKWCGLHQQAFFVSAFPVLPSLEFNEKGYTAEPIQPPVHVAREQENKP